MVLAKVLGKEPTISQAKGSSLRRCKDSLLNSAERLLVIDEKWLIYNAFMTVPLGELFSPSNEKVPRFPFPSGEVQLAVSSSSPRIFTEFFHGAVEHP